MAASRQDRHAYPIAVFSPLQPVQVFFTLDAIDKKHAVQVVNLVVNYDCIKALKDPVKGFTLLIQAGYPLIVRADGFRVKARKTQAAVKVPFLIAGLEDFRVDQGNGRGGFSAATPSTAQSNNHHPAVNVDLRGSQSNSMRVGEQGVG
jgi:hypothetical protein